MHSKRQNLEIFEIHGIIVPEIQLHGIACSCVVLKDGRGSRFEANAIWPVTCVKRPCSAHVAPTENAMKQCRKITEDPSDMGRKSKVHAAQARNAATARSAWFLGADSHDSHFCARTTPSEAREASAPCGRVKDQSDSPESSGEGFKIPLPLVSGGDV